MDSTIIPLLMAAGGIIVLTAVLLVVLMEKKRGSSKQPTINRAEIEQVMQRFVQQVKEENQQLVSNLQRKADRLATEVSDLTHRVKELEAELISMKGALAASEPIQPLESTDLLLLKNRYKRVFELQQEGLQAEEIAKRLGAGQGEIALILSLAATND